MKILVVGGGSGGHITPAVAVVRELLKIKPRARVEFWTDWKYYKNVVKLTTEIGMGWGESERKQGRTGQYIRVRKVLSGKFHRYANWEFKDYFRHFDTTLRELIWGNLVGFLGFLGGVGQSFWRLLRKAERPEVIFLKGGFVCLPVGLMARLFKIPYVIHESDVVAGLANRVLMKKATRVAFGMPLEEEVLEKHKNYEWVGIPVAEEFRPVTAAKQRSLKKAFGFDEEQPLAVVTGGSQGSAAMNRAMREILEEVLKISSVGLVAGRKLYEEMVDLKRYEAWDKAKLTSNFRMWEFNTAMNELMGAADVVVSRAGATTIAELAALKKAVILVPFERLPGGHQVKNAEKLRQEGAVMVVENVKMEEDAGVLLEAIRKVLRSPKSRETMAENLYKGVRRDAAKRLAEILIEVDDERKKQK